MERLLPADPSSVGGHRLVGRLGAGGMGVVYLARSPHGAWVALKVIREEYAEDPGFLARFRRETELASRLSSRWTVPVLTADANARSPWLATAYVPGLPLSDALALQGPWPAAQVRTLGAALAAALDDVHRAGLVHRDVKPANVLLAADGPRLIDFGIARAVGATALTTDGSVIGSPGYLSPEQARGTAVGAPSDVFSLGCVLARTATGRPPFGTGGAAAVLYRTVNEEPDLTGLPHELDATLRACLAKDPSTRPTVAQLRAVFGEFSTPSWLPAGLPAMVADRAATVLDLPVPEPTALSFADSPPTAVPSPSRRRLLVASAALGVSAVGGGTAWWLWGRSGTPTGAGKPTLPRRVIGLLGDLSSAEVRAQQRGAQLAIAQHNARADRAFDLALRSVDDGGTAAGSAAGAARFIADTDVYAVIGAGDDVPVLAAVPVCTEAGVCLLVTRADAEDLTTNTTSTLALRSTRTVGAGSVVRYLNRVVKPTRSVAVHDLTDDQETLPMVRMITVHGKLDGRVDQLDVAADDDFTAAAQDVASGSYDAMIFAGATPARAAACAQALNAAGYRGVRGADEHIVSTPFLKAGVGWWISTGYCDAVADPRTRSFTTAYRARYRTAPPPWAAEAYDAVRFTAQGLATQGGTGRVSLRAQLLRKPWQGITRLFAYDSQSQFLKTDKDGGLFLYQVTDGRLRFACRHDDIRKGV
ncbi:bifunctional serine/threonine-protein kinase/ABC transporter substrate-binding protein [Streptomyces sp. NPDC002499]